MIHPQKEHPQSAYAALLLTLARDEPEALARAAQTLDGDTANHLGVLLENSTGAQLARAYLAFTGKPAQTLLEEGMQRFTFSYPAHVVFEVVSAGGAGAARRVARRSVAAMLESDEPVVGIEGPLPTEPAISNVVVWLGSPSADNDVLELEGIG